jgi:hypothetical protein
VADATKPRHGPSIELRNGSSLLDAEDVPPQLQGFPMQTHLDGMLNALLAGGSDLDFGPGPALAQTASRRPWRTSDRLI